MMLWLLRNPKAPGLVGIAPSRFHEKFGWIENYADQIPMSTQLLESLFGQYKQLEGQQSKSGFTGLVSCIPLLHRVPTPASVRASFAEVTKKQVADWY